MVTVTHRERSHIMHTITRHPISLSRRCLRSRQALSALASAALLGGMILGLSGHALAYTPPQARSFALSPAAFPAASRVVRAGVESNRRLVHDDPLHFQLPPARVGRITGFYMDAVQGSPGAQPRTYTSYLVSIFHSTHQAQTAFDLRWNTWFSTNYYTSPWPAPVTVGDRGEEALFHTLDPRQPHLSELFFRRGPILVEVFQSTGDAVATTSQLQSFYAIATRLDRLAAQHPAQHPTGI